MRIFLIGFMGSGKSYTGKRLAARLGYPFYDLDALIEQETGRSIPEIFAEAGEEGFRQMERQVLQKTEAFERAVISCGGGTPCFFDNMPWMNARGVTVWLRPSLQVLYQRLRRKPHKRPLLAGLTSAQDWMQFLEAKLAERLPYYGQAQLTYEQTDEAADTAGELKAMLRDFLPDFPESVTKTA